MAEIKWIKLSTNMFDDEKIKLIRTMPEGDKIILIWIQLLSLAGRINDGGLVYMGQNLAYSDEMLATILGHPVNIMRVALQALEQFNMIDITENGVIDIANWEKHQSTDKMAKLNKQNRERQQKYYYRNKLRILGVDVDSDGFTEDLEEMKVMLLTLSESNVSQTLPNDTEVRSKKLEVRSKKLEVRLNNNTVNKLTESELKSKFEPLWNLYPNKKGKAKAFAAYKKAVKDGVNDDEIQAGVTKYALEIKNKRTAPEYIAHGSTWFSNRRWEDRYDVGNDPNDMSWLDTDNIFDGFGV